MQWNYKTGFGELRYYLDYPRWKTTFTLTALLTLLSPPPRHLCSFYWLCRLQESFSTWPHKQRNVLSLTFLVAYIQVFILVYVAFILRMTLSWRPIVMVLNSIFLWIFISLLCLVAKGKQKAIGTARTPSQSRWFPPGLPGSFLHPARSKG